MRKRSVCPRYRRYTILRINDSIGYTPIRFAKNHRHSSQQFLIIARVLANCPSYGNKCISSLSHPWCVDFWNLFGLHHSTLILGSTEDIIALDASFIFSSVPDELTSKRRSVRAAFNTIASSFCMENRFGVRLTSATPNSPSRIHMRSSSPTCTSGSAL